MRKALERQITHIRTWRGIIRQEVWRHDPTRIHFDVAWRCTPAIAGIILGGSLLHQAAAAAIMCGGALTTGSGVFQQFGRSRFGPMAAAAMGMGVSAAIGTLAGWSSGLLIPAVMLWGFASGLLQALSGGGQWIGQQCTIALIVASSFPGTFGHALQRAGLVMGGGIVQIVMVEAIFRFTDVNAEWKGWPETWQHGRDALQTLRTAIAGRSLYLRFAVRVAVTLGFAVAAERSLTLPNGYWVGMTTLLLFRLEFHDTWHRSASRICGTLAGAGIVVLAGHAGGPAWAFAAAIPAAAWFCFAFQQFSYALFSFGLTAYIVLLLSYGGLQGLVIAHNRVVGTLMGAGFALAGHLHFAAGENRLSKRTRQDA